MSDVNFLDRNDSTLYLNVIMVGTLYWNIYLFFFNGILNIRTFIDKKFSKYEFFSSFL